MLNPEGLEIFGWVIMPGRVRMIVGSRKDKPAIDHRSKKQRTNLPAKYSDMIFKANNLIADQCISKYQRSMNFMTVFLLVFAVLELLTFYNRNKDVALTIIFAIIAAFVFYRFTRAIRIGATLINRLVNSVEIDETNFSFSTFDASLFFSLIKRKSITITSENFFLSEKPSEVKYGFNEELTKDIYILTCNGKEYLIAERFFEDFEMLRSELLNFSKV